MAPGSRDKSMWALKDCYPCGVGKQDHGFVIRGLETVPVTIRMRVFMLWYLIIYSEILRSMSKKKIPLLFSWTQSTYCIGISQYLQAHDDFAGHGQTWICKWSFHAVSYDGDIRELKSASDIINNYSKLLCNMAGIHIRDSLWMGKELVLQSAWLSQLMYTV